MSKFFSSTLDKLTPYTPGEQPQDQQYVKLNTNESPYPVSKKALEYMHKNLRSLNLYPDPECRRLCTAFAGLNGLKASQVMPVNGSDEALFFAFKAFCDSTHPAVFADITYGFYPVFAEINNVPYREIPLTADFSVKVDDYAPEKTGPATVFIANPNAPTGKLLSLNEIERLLRMRSDGIVLIDEAYIDFGGESAVGLIDRYENLLVTQTFSKSRSFAGGRLGFIMGNEELIKDLNTVRYSFNPYNIDSMSMALAEGIIADQEYTLENCRKICETRAYLTEELRKLGFEVPDSGANFIFVRTDRMSGGDIYLRLKEKGVLVRHFTKPRIADYNRITIGTPEQTDILLERLREVLAGQ